ncbi:MAG: dihydroxyacetone kinase subunit L [Pelolinea sp.]|jgi:dihydroxyacetone kinase phosphoprotein-dependent L subunit|nr:dihydroxyacetone kinase subunit L [Pelolinea sp.]
MFNYEQGKNFLLFLKEIFDQQCPALNNLDSIVGDGDHGFTMQRGVNEIHQKLMTSEYHDFAQLFDLAAVAFAENSGGAIGPILSAFFAEGGILFKGKTALSTEDLAVLFKHGSESIMQVGDTALGDKTILDAIVPVQEFLFQNTGKEPDQVLEDAWKVAQAAAFSTKTMIAKKGRARFLKELSKTYQDAGATSFSWIVFALWKAAKNEIPILSKDPSQQTTFQPHGKFINSPETIVQQDNQGLSLAYPDLVKLTDDGILIRARPKEIGKVGLAIGHGGGHTPSMGGFIGPGLLDSDVYGPIFTCASGINIFKAIQHADRGAGVILLVSNHSGDVLNARIAEKRAKQENIPLEVILLGDDIATASRDQISDRRGLGGLLFALKIGGAAAERGYPMSQIAEIMRRTNERTATLSVGLSAPTHPITGKPLFEAKEDHLEIGTGVHGEAGVYNGELRTADEVIELLIGQLLDDLKKFKEKRYLAFINGLGGTSRMELHILFQKTFSVLHQQAIQPVGSVVDSYFTNQAMKGFSLSLCVLTDEMEMLWNDPASGPCFHWPYR